jgi:glycosyltransferase involved in cell wall biosynthesis
VISIVIPTYNRANIVKGCIESVVQQATDNVEVIVVDDGSTDATGELLQQLQQQYTGLRVISNPGNHGVNYARNRGIERASGDFIMFLDSDDRLAAGCLHRISETIDDNPGRIHFLFCVSDRKAEFSTTTRAKLVDYEDWIKGYVGGDFIHVVAASVMKRYLFFERFRMYEYLNWLRVFKTTAPQLLVPFIAVERDRNRADSLTSAARLQDAVVIKDKFESRKLYYTLYHDDLRLFQSNALSKKLLAAVMLGVACNKRKASYQLLKYGNRLTVKLAGSLILLIPPVVVRKFIMTWSALK